MRTHEVYLIQLGVCCRLDWTARCSCEGVACVSALDVFRSEGGVALHSRAMHAASAVVGLDSLLLALRW